MSRARVKSVPSERAARRRVAGARGIATGVAPACELAILDALPEYLIVLDCQGMMIAANAVWRALARARGGERADYGLKEPYLEVAAAVLHGPCGAAEADAAIADMVTGGAVKAVVEYRMGDAAGERWLQLLATRSTVGDVCRIILLYLDITERKRAEHEAQTRADQQAAVAELGRRALMGVPLAVLREEAVRAVARGCRVPLVKILMITSPAQARLVAGLGWKEGLIGLADVSLGQESQAGYTLACAEPVIVSDLRCERRFSGPALLHDHGVISGISVIIGGKPGPWGVLGAHTTTERRFSRDDVNFVHSIANVLAEATDRARTEAEIRHSSALLRMAAHTAHLGGWTYDPQRDVMAWSGELCALHGVREPTRSLGEALAFVVPGLRDAARASWRRCVDAGEPFDIEIQITTAQGRLVWVRALGSAEWSATGDILHVQGAYQDITEKKNAERELANAHRALQMLSRCNEALAWSDDETALLNEICKIAVEIGGYRMAFVGYPEQDAAHTIRPVAYAGHEGARFLADTHMSWDAGTPAGHGAAGRALRSGVFVCYENLDAQIPIVPWYDRARACGYRAVFCLPLKDHLQTFGVLCLYAGEARTLGPEEVRSLKELAANLAFGIRHARSESHRRAMESVLEVAAAGSAAGGDEFFTDLTRDIARALKAWGVFVVRLGGGGTFVAQAVIGVVAEAPVPAGDELLAGMPWAALVCDRQWVIPEPFARHCPQAQALHAAGVRAMVGQRLDNAEGAATGLLCAAFDRTPENLPIVHSALSVFAARAAGELARQEADRRIHEQAALLDKAHDAIILEDLEGRVVYWNAGASRLYGWDETQMRGRALRETIYGREGPPSRALAEVRARGEWVGEIVQTRRNGETITVESHWTLVRDAKGWPHAILHINTDITERLSVQNQLRQAQRLEAIGQLTGGIAHDFNNLLTVILGSSDLLAQGVAGRPELMRLADMSRAAAERGAQLTRRLLAFARRQALAPQSVDVNQLLRDMEGLLRGSLSENIEIHQILATDPWPALVDPAQLEGAILNLCINARDAMARGGRIAIETENVTLDAACGEAYADVAPGDYVALAISDTGCGIAPGDMQRVFDPFFTTKEFGKGTGLGLSMVYGFVRQSHGYIKISSEVGRGTIVKMLLPRARTDCAASAALVTKPPLPGGSEHILLVEDNELVRGYAERQLLALGYRVTAVGTAHEALAVLADETDIALLFTDIVMPGGMNGVELAACARAHDPRLRVLYTSGYSEHALAGQSDGALAHPFLRKPYRPADLAMRLREALRSSGPGLDGP